MGGEIEKIAKKLTANQYSQEKGVMMKTKVMEKAIAILLAAVMFFTTLISIPISVKAENPSNALVDVISNTDSAIKTTQTVIDVTDAKSWGGPIVSGLNTYLGNIQTGLNIANTVLNFLGFGKKGASEPTIEELMYAKILDIYNKQTEIQNQIKNLLEMLAQFQAQYDVDFRAKKASDFWQAWLQFNTDYSEQLDKFMKNYQTKLNDAVVNWCENPEKRIEVVKTNETNATTPIDNTAITLYYKANSGNANDSNDEKVEVRDWIPVLNPDPNNAAPSDMTDAPHIILKAECLPELDDTTAEYYRKDLKEAFIESVTTALNTAPEEDRDNLIDVRSNSDSDFAHIFTADAWLAASEEEKTKALDTLYEDFHEALMYRLSIIVVHQNNDFVTEVITKFNQYCERFRTFESGLDALTKSLMNSHGMEGEIRDQYEQICGQLILQLSQYATFTMDLIGKTKAAATEEDAVNTSKNWADTAEYIENYMQSFLTGYDNYSYITGGYLTILPLELNVEVTTVVNSSDKSKRKYGGYKDLKFEVNFADYVTPFLYPLDYKLNTTEGLVHYMTFRAGASGNSTVADFAQKIDDFGGGKYAEVKNHSTFDFTPSHHIVYPNEQLILDWNSPSPLLKDDDLPMVRQQFKKGANFDGGRQYDKNNRDFPNDRDYAMKMTGDILDRSSGALLKDTIFAALLVNGKKGSEPWNVAFGPSGESGEYRLTWYENFMDSLKGGCWEHNDDYLYTIVSLPEPDSNEANSLEELNDLIWNAPEKAGKVRIKLMQDIIAPDSDVTVNIPTGRSIVLDLNGHTIQLNGNNSDEKAVIRVSGNLELRNGTVKGGNGTAYGIYSGTYHDLTLDNVTVTNCDCGILADGGDNCIFNKCTIENNRNEGMHLDTCYSVSATDTNIRKNGQGIYGYGVDKLDLTSVKIENNGSNVEKGAGLYLHTWETDTTTLTKCTISNNTATVSGGGIYIENDGHLTLDNCTLTGNQAPEGSAFYNDAYWADILFKSCSITGNSGSEGGAVQFNCRGQIKLDGTVKIQSNSPRDAYRAGGYSVDIPLFAVQPGMNKDSRIGIASGDLKSSNSVVVATQPSGGGFANCFEPNQQYSGFKAKVTEKGEQILLEKVTSTSLIEAMKDYRQHPEKYDHEALMRLLADYELLNQYEEHRKQMTAEYADLVKTIAEIRTKVCGENHHDPYEAFEIILLKAEKSDPEWRYMLQSSVIAPENLSEAMKAKLGDQWKVLAAADIDIIRYREGDAEGPFTIGFTGEGFAQYKNSDVTVFHEKAEGDIEQLKPTWDESKQCFAVTTESCSPFVLAVDATSVNTGITADNSDLTPIISLLVLAMAGLGLVIIRRRTDKRDA